MNGAWALAMVIIILCQWQFAALFPDLERTISLWIGRVSETLVLLLALAVLDAE